MLDRLGAEHQVELGIGEGERLVRLEAHEVDSGQPAAGPVERHLRDIGAHQPVGI